DVRALGLEPREQRLDERTSDAHVARIGQDAEELDPTGRLLEAELTAAHLAEHEANDSATDLSHLRRIGITADVVDDAVLPGVGSVLSGDALIDRKSTRLNSSHVATSYAV